VIDLVLVAGHGCLQLQLLTDEQEVPDEAISYIYSSRLVAEEMDRIDRGRCGVRASGAGVLGLEKGYRTFSDPSKGEWEMAGSEHGGDLASAIWSVLYELAFSELALTVWLSRSSAKFRPNLIW
jgi:hypothetical protein